MNQTTRTVLLCLLVVGCSGGGKGGAARGGDTLTERQRDSILAKSSIPGASGVGRALQAADSTNARIRATDSVQP